MNTNNAIILEKPSADFLQKKAIYSISKFTMLDYPDKTACILWFSGCNMKCAYCYNPEVVFGKGQVSFSELFSFLKQRVSLLDAVVFSGGECLLHKDIIEVIRRVKELGFLVKVDTNGSKPAVLKQLLEENLLDYVAMDFKGTKEKFKNITGINAYAHFMECLQALKESTIPFEIRTTLHSSLLSQEDILSMYHTLKSQGYEKEFYIQNFRNYQETIAPLPDSEAMKSHHLPTSMTKIIFR